MVASRESESHPLQWPPAQRQNRSSCPPLFTLPSQIPEVIFKTPPPTPAPRHGAAASTGSRNLTLHSARCGGVGGKLRQPALLTPASGAGCWRLSEARVLPARLLQRFGPGPLPAQVLQQPLSAPHQPRGRGSSYSFTAPLHTSLMAPLSAVWENDFSPLPETDFLHFISPHRPSGSKMLTFSGGRQTQLTLIYPSNGERLYYKSLAAVPKLGPSSSPLLVPQTLT